MAKKTPPNLIKTAKPAHGSDNGIELRILEEELAVEENE